MKIFIISAFQVWNLKTCSVCLKDERNRSELFVHHMAPILKYLQSKKVVPLMWDDMMRHWPVEHLKGIWLYMSGVFTVCSSLQSSVFVVGKLHFHCKPCVNNLVV